MSPSVKKNNQLQAGMLLFILEGKLQRKERDVTVPWLFMEGLFLKRLLNQIQCTTEASKRGFRDLKFACGHQYTLCEQMAGMLKRLSG